MTRFKLIACGIASILFLHGCSKILEPISLFGGKQGVKTEGVQEVFEINIKSLTFESAKKANNAPYSRKLMLIGSGASANVFDEADFLKQHLPKSSNNPNYYLGVGDELSFVQLNEFETEIAQWPTVPKKSEYLLGAGDQLTFVRSSDSSQKVTVTYNEDGQMVPETERDELIQSEGVIGNNGNIQLFGLGNILAANRTLDDVRTEVRNILIRNGLSPDYQLEISDFQSRKAFVTISNGSIAPIRLNNLPISLKEVALEAGLSGADKSFALIKFTRNAQEFRVTAEQLFDLAAPEIFI
ncbi:hypothetical protein OAB16_00875, partial [Planktomarina sp.]|nr:hypothetical protein [Planktomarina sp.]